MQLKKEKIATVLCVLVVGFTLVGKLLRSPQVVEQMENLGLQEHLILLAILEIVALVLYVIPKTFHLGFFLLTAYYGGAIAVNLNSPVDAIPALVFMVIVWVLSYIRSPRLFFPDLQK